MVVPAISATVSGPPENRAGAWLIACVLVGALSGALGNASRPQRRASIRSWGWGLLVAAPVAEGIGVSRWQGPHVLAGVVLLLLAAGLYVWAVRRDRAPWQMAAVTAVAVAPAVLVAENFRHML